jgi:hypothetical protein
MRSNGRAFQPIHLRLRRARDTCATTAVEAAVSAAMLDSAGDTRLWLQIALENPAKRMAASVVRLSGLFQGADYVASGTATERRGYNKSSASRKRPEL